MRFGRLSLSPVRLRSMGLPSAMPVMSSPETQLYAIRPPQSGSPSSASENRNEYNSSLSFTPLASANTSAHALRSEVQLLQWTITAISPAGVATTSVLRETDGLRPETTVANTDVPADTFPVPTRTQFVATMPVPASPSGGQRGTPASRSPSSSNHAAPAAVSLPASLPAASGRGSMSVMR